MKKSKILAVALSALTFSTAAAVTGTVAWYFAQRTVSVSMTNITSFNPESGLKVTLSDGIGTNVQQATSQSASSPAKVKHSKIRDASVDLENQKAYKTILNHQGNKVLGYEELDLSSAAQMKGESTEEGASASETFFYAASYNAKFELTRRTKGTKFAVYYDNSQLTVGGSSLVQESLRLGFLFDAGTPEDDSDDSFFVVAPFRNANGGAFVNGTTLTDEGDYENIGSPAENRMIYGFETTYEKKFASYYNSTGTEVTVDDFDDTNYRDNEMFVDKYVESTDPEHPGWVISESEAQVYAATVADDAEPTDDNLGSLPAIVAEADAPDTIGYLGILDGDAAVDPDAPDDPVDNLAINVKVVTWFEGLDESSITEWVDNKPLTVNLSFDMIEVR